MENKKLERLATILVDLLSGKNHDEIWLSLLNKRDSYSDYFSKMSTQDFFKLYILIISLKKQKTFEWAYKNLRNLMFIDFVYTELEEHMEECEECEGDGSRSCSYCDGSGREECSYCDGNGTVDCDECDGDGNIETEDGTLETCENCDGDGTVECDECDGSGTTDCRECYGNGNYECDECEASGEISHPLIKNYTLFRYCSWNKNLNDICEIRKNTEQGISDDDFYDLTKKGCLMYMKYEYSGIPKKFVEADVFYPCFSDDLPPKIDFKGDSRLSSSGTETDFYFKS